MAEASNRQDFFNKAEIVTGSGFHVALGREHAKRLFGIKDDESLRQFVEELTNSKEIRSSGRLVESGPHWATIHCCLTDGELDPAGGEFPLNHVVLGGKALHRGDDYTAVLVRPDMTLFIAEALGDLKQADFRAKFDALRSGLPETARNKEFIEVWRTLVELRALFDDAAANLEAVLFTTEMGTGSNSTKSA